MLTPAPKIAANFSPSHQDDFGRIRLNAKQSIRHLKFLTENGLLKQGLKVILVEGNAYVDATLIKPEGYYIWLACPDWDSLIDPMFTTEWLNKTAKMSAEEEDKFYTQQKIRAFVVLVCVLAVALILGLSYLSKLYGN